MPYVRIKDVAQRAGVHPSTVSLALRNSTLIADETRQRIHAIAEEMDYQPNLLAKGLAGEKTFTAGVVVNQLTDDFNIRVFSAQEQCLREHSYNALMTVTHADEANELKAINDFSRRRVDGLIMNYPVRNPRTIAELERLMARGLPVVMYLSGFSTPGLPGLDVVDADLFRCGYDITRHLLELGHRRITVLTSNPQGQRVAGYRTALAEFDVPFDEKLIIEVHYPYAQGVEYVKEIMSYKHHPTAIFAFNDDLAVEILRELHSRGYRVPEDISLASVNDNRLSGELRVPLTTIRLPQEQIGISLVQMLMQRLAEPELPPQKQVHRGELILRASTAQLGIDD